MFTDVVERLLWSLCAFLDSASASVSDVRLGFSQVMEIMGKTSLFLTDQNHEAIGL